jgi:hypothetical protein
MHGLLRFVAALFLLFVLVMLVIHLHTRVRVIVLNFMTFFSHKMHMGWRSLQQKCSASIITKILELSAALGGSITFMALMVHGKVCS